MNEELAIVHHRPAANWVGAALIVAISALATMVVTVPPVPSPAAIGGGPSPESEESVGGMVCQTADGAPYLADHCPP